MPQLKDVALKAVKARHNPFSRVPTFRGATSLELLWLTLPGSHKG